MKALALERGRVCTVLEAARSQLAAMEVAADLAPGAGLAAVRWADQELARAIEAVRVLAAIHGELNEADHALVCADGPGGLPF